MPTSSICTLVQPSISVQARLFPRLGLAQIHIGNVASFLNLSRRCRPRRNRVAIRVKAWCVTTSRWDGQNTLAVDMIFVFGPALLKAAELLLAPLKSRLHDPMSACPEGAGQNSPASLIAPLPLPLSTCPVGAGQSTLAVLGPV